MGAQSADVHSQQASSHNVLTIVISLIRLIPHPYSDVLICSFSQTNSNGNALVFWRETFRLSIGTCHQPRYLRRLLFGFFDDESVLIKFGMSILTGVFVSKHIV